MKLKKIGILTFFDVNNFGADLQAFALSHFLNKQGHDSEIIRYYFYKNKNHVRTKNSKPDFKLPFSKRALEFLYPFYIKFKSYSFKSATKKRRALFKDFVLNHIRFSKEEYKTYEDLIQAKLDYEIIIVGSDQVWNPNLNTSLKPYLLNFESRKSVKKISYAASFGVNYLPEDHKLFYRKFLNEFKAISCREESGVEIVKKLKLPLINPTQVLDPTLLLSKKEWSNLSSNRFNFEQPYLLIYVISESEYIYSVADYISKKLKLNIIQITKDNYPQNRNPKIRNLIDVGPLEFIELFKRANFILTSSFHGTCFSVIFNTPFFVILNPNKDNNSRQINFLESVSLENKLLFYGDERIFGQSFSQLVDLSAFDKIAFLKKLKKSKEFLIKETK